MRAATAMGVIVVCGASALAGPVHLVFAQDFEAGTAGLDVFNGGTLARYPSGAGGISAPQGSYFGRGLLNSSDGTTPGGGGGSGYRATGPFGGQVPSPLTFVSTRLQESVKLFLDPGAGLPGDSWFCTTTHERQRGFWFNTSSTGQLDVLTGFNGGAIDLGVRTPITSPGWYTFENSYDATGTPNLFDVHYLIRGPGGDVLLNLGGTTSIGGSPAAPAFFNWVVGWNQGRDQNIAVDDISFTLDGVSAQVVPLPTSAALALAGLGAAGVMRRRRA